MEIIKNIKLNKLNELIKDDRKQGKYIKITHYVYKYFILEEKQMINIP